VKSTGKTPLGGAPWAAGQAIELVVAPRDYDNSTNDLTQQQQHPDVY
jgi:hypothetical protein